MAGLGDIAGKGKDALANEGASDKVLDAGEKGADKLTGGSHDEQIDAAREQADKRVGE